MKVKKGDNVLVISGKDKGSKGEVLQCAPKENRIIISGVNMITRHTKPRKQGQQGGRLKKEGFIDASNVLVICPKCDKATRVGYKTEKVKDEIKKTRICKKCSASLDK